MAVSTTVNLHTHTAVGNPDSRTPPGVMLQAYAQQDIDRVGVLAHDELVRLPDLGHPVLAGVEHTIDPGTLTHIVEYPDYDYRFLAHPGLSFGDAAKARAMMLVEEYDLDGVEKWNNGRRQYAGELPVPELANDDAHSPPAVGLSYMEVEAPNEPVALFRALRRGEFEVVNRPRRLDRWAGKVEKGLSSMPHIPPG